MPVPSQHQSSPSDSLWSNPSWLDEPSQETPWLAPERYATLATRTELQVPIESVPIGSRVSTKNPNRFEVDPQPEPDQATWAKLSITVERSDGGIVDAEIIRPRSWILANGLCAGRMLPLNLPELEVSGLALVTAIDDCPPIACGEGSVVTARFATREVHIVASADVLGADGSVETITGTTIHPVRSVDRQEWVPLAELAEGERLQGLDGLAVVLSVSLSRVSQAVYNIEVHGEHVYQVGELGLVVHNSGEDCFVIASRLADRMGGQVHFLKPLGRYGTGQLPNDSSQYGAYAYHAFVLKGSRYFDEFFENGIEFVDWLSQYKQLNNFSDETMELLMKIDETAPPGVWK